MRIKKNSQSTFQKILSKDMLFITDRRKNQFHSGLVKNFNTFMYNQTLHRDRKHFCCYCSQFFTTAQILERHANDYFEINDKQLIKTAK